MRMKMKRICLGAAAVLFVVVVFRIGSSPMERSISSSRYDNDFEDLFGSRKILDPLVIHARPEVLIPKATAAKTTTKGPSKTTTQRSRKDYPDVLAMKAPALLTNYKNPCWKEPGTNRVRCLPYFHLIGVDKSGTTDLWFRLSKHPDLVRPEAVMGKETHWWSWRRFGFDIWINTSRIQSFEEYLRAFDKPAKQIESVTETYKNVTDYHRLITGEGSPTVFWDMTGWNLLPQNKNKSADTAAITPHCIRHMTPKAKFIIIFRNPTDRLYSDYLFLQIFRSRTEPLTAKSFHDDVEKSIAMLNSCQKHNSLHSCLYNKTLHMNIPVRLPISFYAVYLKEWFKVFPRESFLILRNEDYAKDIRGHLEKVYNFLDLKKVSPQELDKISQLKRAFTRKKEHQSVGDMLLETRTLLNSFHKNLNLDLAKVLNDDRYSWTSDV